MGRLLSNPGYHIGDLARILLLAAAYCGLAAWVLNSSLTLGDGNVTILWLPGGMALAGLLIGGIKLWPGLFIGAFAAGILVEDPVWVSTTIALGNLLETIAAVVALSHCQHFDSQFRKPSDFILLIAIAATSACISALIGPVTLALAGFIPLSDLANAMFRWWQADALGMILIVPLLLIWRKAPEDWLETGRWVETVAGLTCGFIVNQIVFGGWWNLSIGGSTQNLWPLPFLIWIATRRGTHGVTLFVALTAIQAFEGARKGVGFFANDLQASGLLNLWIFILIISLVGIGLALTIKAQQRLKRHLESIIHSTSECINLVARDGVILAMNPAGLAYVDAKSSDQVVFGNIKPLIAPEHWNEYQILHRNACDGMPGQLEFELISLQGRRRWMESKVVPFYDDLSDQQVQLAFTRDITERKTAERKLTLAANVFKHVRESIIITDADRNIIDVNDTFCQISGYRADEVMGKNPRFLQSGRQPAEFYAEMWQTIGETGFWEGEIWNKHKLGYEFAVLLTISAVADESGKIISYIGLFNDITSIKNKQSQLEDLAHHDQLTGLPNRLLLMDRLQQAMAQCDRGKQTLAVVFIDLDGFKQINDRHGHAIGDRMLISVAHRLRQALREADTLARLGGDEFIGILSGLDNNNDVIPVLDRLLQAASLPVNLDALTLQVSISIGVSFYPGAAEAGDLLIRHADQAMYQAKNAGKNCYQLFANPN